jgi:TRAP-type C4-dicarboxylate transport system substrate-binding protein
MTSPAKARTAPGWGAVLAVGAGAAALACLLAGCTSGGTKAGRDQPATVLHLATVEPSDAPYTKDAEFFARRVAELTAGSVQVTIDSEVIPWTPNSEQQVTGMVQQGTTDLALVPPRVLDTLGITDFQVLQTPLLIDSPELAGVVATSAVAQRMLARLGDRHLVGLGLVYEGLRQPLALNGAVTRAQDLQGLQVRVPVSQISDTMFAALGAIPDHGDSHTVSTTGAPYPVVETELALAPSGFPTPSTLTRNITYFPKYDAILGNPDAIARLNQGQQEAIKQAARDTVAESLQTTADEQALAAAYCEAKGDLVVAPDSEIAALNRKFQPVVTQLRTDRATAEEIDAIQALKASTKVPRFQTPPACLPPAGDGARLPGPPAAPRP